MSSTLPHGFKLSQQLPNLLEGLRHHRPEQKAPSHKTASSLRGGHAFSLPAFQRAQGSIENCTKNSEQPYRLPWWYWRNTVYIQEERGSDGACAMTGHVSEKANADDNSATPPKSNETSTANAGSESIGTDESMLAAANDDSTAPISSGSIGVDESVLAPAVQTVESPSRVSEKASTRPQNLFRNQIIDVSTSTVGMDEGVMSPTGTVAALMSPKVSPKKANSRPGKLRRSTTVGAIGQLDTESIPEEKLQDLMGTFTQYDEDGNGRLTILEFSKFLEDQGMTDFRYSDLEEAVAMVVPEGSTSIDLASFKQLIARGLRDEALREEQLCGYSQEDADVLRKVFNAYDANHSGALEAAEVGNLLQDMGQAPNSLSEQEELRAVLERIVGGNLRPLRFREFLELAKILEETTIGSGGQYRHPQAQLSRHCFDPNEALPALRATSMQSKLRHRSRRTMTETF